MIQFNDFYQMLRKAQEVGWETQYLKWHVYEPMLDLDSFNAGGTFLKPSRILPKNQILGIDAVLYPEHARGEIFGCDAALEYNRPLNACDAYVLKDNKITLMKWWIIPAGIK